MSELGIYNGETVYWWHWSHVGTDTPWVRGDTVCLYRGTIVGAMPENLSTVHTVRVRYVEASEVPLEGPVIPSQCKWDASAFEGEWSVFSNEIFKHFETALTSAKEEIRRLEEEKKKTPGQRAEELRLKQQQRVQEIKEDKEHQARVEAEQEKARRRKEKEEKWADIIPRSFIFLVWIGFAYGLYRVGRYLFY